MPTPRRILAIDDDPISLAVAAVLLEAEGSEVLQAESGEQALELLEEGDAPDCVIADLRMPTLSGPELAARLRASAPDALLLAMSATPPAGVEGYDAVLKKPLSPEALRAAFARTRQPQDALDATAWTQASEAVATDSDDEAAVLDSAVFDRLLRAMSTEALAEVVSVFVHDTDERIANMRAADAGTIRRQAHTVKGGASMLGAIGVANTASTVEAGIDHHGERLRKLDEMESYLRRTEVILKQRLKV
ncbi:MAG TPA: response regulator [Acidobacteriaceae bacterium]|nr:response regulator [Acidobacteriaceae bacterium]